MLINVTDSRLVVGRMNILPGEKVPALPLSEAEQAAVNKLVKERKLVEKPHPNQQAQPKIVTPAKTQAKAKSEPKSAEAEVKPAESEAKSAPEAAKN